MTSNDERDAIQSFVFRFRPEQYDKYERDNIPVSNDECTWGDMCSVRDSSSPHKCDYRKLSDLGKEVRDGTSNLNKLLGKSEEELSSDDSDVSKYLE